MGQTLITIKLRQSSADLTTLLDERGSMGSRVVLQGGVTGDQEVQEVPTSEARSSGAVIVDAEDGKSPIGESFDASD